MKKYIFIVMLMSLSVLAWSNSVFSFDGYAVSGNGYDTYSLGMGETGSADLFRINLSLNNPSLATTMNNVVYSSAISLSRTNYSSADNEYAVNEAIIPYFNIVAPIKNSRLLFNFSSYLSGNYKTIKNETQTIEGQEVNYEVTDEISSDIYQASLGYGYKNKFIDFAIAGRFYFGNKTISNEKSYNITGFANTNIEQEQIFKNPGIGLGFNKRIKNNGFALTYDSAVELEGKTKITNNIDSFEYENTSFKIPHSFTFGYSYKLKEVYKFSTDMDFDLWEKESSAYRNTYRIGCGLAYDPLSGEDDWYKKIPLRAGFYYNQLPFKVQQTNQYLDELAYTLGFSIPLRSPKKKIDVAVKYLKRGSIDDHNFEEDAIFITFELKGLDFFRKRYRKTEPRKVPLMDGSQKEY